MGKSDEQRLTTPKRPTPIVDGLLAELMSKSQYCPNAAGQQLVDTARQLESDRAELMEALGDLTEWLGQPESGYSNNGLRNSKRVADALLSRLSPQEGGKE